MVGVCSPLPSTSSLDKSTFHAEPTPPVLTHYVRPNTPACGTGVFHVTVDLTVGADGQPRDFQVAEEAVPSLSEAIVKAIEAWRYAPASLNGKPADAHGRVEMECGEPAPSAGPAAAAMRVGADVSMPSVLYKIEPHYTEEARQSKYQGTVALYVEVDPSGRARNIRTVRALGLGLDKKAMEAVLQWRFNPGMKDGKPVTVAATIQVNFRLL
jgi:TonB family protein